MNGLGPTVLGIDYGDAGVRAVMLAAGPRRPHLIGAATVPAGSVEEGAARIRAWLQGTCRTCASIVFTVPARYATVDRASLGRIPAQEVANAARYRLGRKLPGAGELAVAVAGVEDDAYLLLGADRAAVRRRAEALAEVGLEATDAEPETFALVRWLGSRIDARERRGASTALLVGAASATLAVVEGGHVAFARSVPVGWGPIEDLLDPAAHACVMPNGTVRDAAGRTQDARPVLDALVAETTRLTRYFRSSHPDRSFRGVFDEVLLASELAGLPGATEYLSNRLGFEVAPATPLASLPAHLSEDELSGARRLGSGWVVALGAALRYSESLTRKEVPLGTREVAWARAA